jgi:methyl-accepting chemotaxis protein
VKTSTLNFKLTVFLVATVAITTAIAGGMYFLLRDVESESTSRLVSVLKAKNTTYQLLETLVDAQAALQSTLRLKEPDEIEKGIGLFKELVGKAQQTVKNNTALPKAIGEKLSALVEIDQQAIAKFLMGENSAAFELMINTVPLKLDALLGDLRAHNALIETAVNAETAVAQTSLRRKLLVAIIASSTLLLLSIAYGVRFRSLTISQLRRLTTGLGASSENVASVASEVSTSSQSLANGASDQAASLEETSASLEELSSMTKRNAESAKQAKELSNQTRASAEGGATRMEEMRRAMNAIKLSSNDVSKIIKTIDEIAFQTNILALNAAVEAARAGEAGLGFAVVAEEVRNLAQRSAQAAKETATKIEDAISKSEHGVAISGDFEKVLADILAKARQVDSLVAEIATASVEQNEGIGQIGTAIGQIDKVTQSNASGAEEAAAAAEELNAQAAMMHQSVTELRLLVDGGKFAAALSTPAQAAPLHLASERPKLLKPVHRQESLRSSNTSAPNAGRYDEQFAA